MFVDVLAFEEKVETGAGQLVEILQQRFLDEIHNVVVLGRKALFDLNGTFDDFFQCLVGVRLQLRLVIKVSEMLE